MKNDSPSLLDLVNMFEQAEDSSLKQRTKAERDQDYYDGKQWTDAEVKELQKRRQPAITQNLIRQKIDFLQGLERNQKTEPKALPRTPRHEQEALSCTDALRYVCDNNRYDRIRSQVWKDLLVIGWGGVEVVAEQRGDDIEVVLKRCPWDRMFWDPYSHESDFSDATYQGLVIWMDRSEAVRRYGEQGGGVFDEMVSSRSQGDTYDDKPRQVSWIDSNNRPRIRVVQMYYTAKDGSIDFCEFTKGGILNNGASPWLDEDGASVSPYHWQSAFIDRDNNRYGAVRDLVDPQDEVNKRRSKALHHFTVRQTFGTDAALSKDANGIRGLRQEMAKPDGHILLRDGIEFGREFGIIPTNDQASGHFELLSQATQVFEVLGPNQAMMGKKDGNESGRAIMAQQQGGAIQIGSLTSVLRDLDYDIYKSCWNRIRQFWQGEKWVRVTDDMQNLKWVGLNVPMQDDFGMFQGIQNEVASLEVDIDIGDAPDMGTIMQEEFANLVELARMGIQFPPEIYIKASNLRNKGELSQILQEAGQNPMQQQGAQIEMQKAVADIEKTQAETGKIASEIQYKQSETNKNQVESQLAIQQSQQELNYAL